MYFAFTSLTLNSYCPNSNLFAIEVKEMPERGKRHGASDRLGKGPTISDSSSVDKDNPSNIMNKKAGPGKSSDSSSKGPAESSTAARPDTRTLISGTTSWTGKLPVNLLSEHCQRAKWEKPEYSMVYL